ncbi:MAG: hypothetical protein GXP40_11925 [Chloroflexi bacterium]|nr:hypothetical protein [Chloroflexota bacterium]
MDIVVALGGGGAKGNAHIGVLRRLEKEGYHIRAVAGTSAGGLVAALYAAGYSPDEIEAIYSAVDQTKLYARRPNEGPALLGLAGVDQWLDEVVGERTFAGLRIPCALTAVDINSTCEVILQKGRLKDAMLATIALPGIFPPHRVDGHELVDGGVLDPVPVSVACSLAPDLPVVAVVLSSPVGPTTSYQLPVSLPGVIPDSIVKRLTRMRITQAFNIFLHSVEIGNRLMAELRLEADDPDVIIRPDVKHINLLDRVDVHEVARLGEEAVEKALPDLKRAVAWHSRLRRQLFGRGRA